MASFKNRALAYFLDMILLTIVLSLISSFFTRSSNYVYLNDQLESITNKYVDGVISIDEYIRDESVIVQKIDKENVFINLIEGFLIFGYFILLPYYNDGRTLGKMLFKIKIISDDGNQLKLQQLIIRTLIINGLGYLLLTMGVLYILSSLGYYIFTNFLSIIEFGILVASCIMVIKNNNHKGIHDILSKTSVVND